MTLPPSPSRHKPPLHQNQADDDDHHHLLNHHHDITSATDLSRDTERTHYTLPSDGQPVTISTLLRNRGNSPDHGSTSSIAIANDNNHKAAAGAAAATPAAAGAVGAGAAAAGGHRHSLTPSAASPGSGPHHENKLKKSHTSLLIEYFESSKRGPNGTSSRPTVRVSPSRGGTLTASTNASGSAMGMGVGSSSKPLSSSAGNNRPATASRQQSQQSRYPIHRAPVRQSDSRTSSTATSSSEEIIDPIAAREGKRAAVTSSASYQPGSGSTRPGTGYAGASSILQGGSGGGGGGGGIGGGGGTGGGSSALGSNSGASTSANPPPKFQYRYPQTRRNSQIRQSSHGRSQSHSQSRAQQHGKGYARYDEPSYTDDDRRASTDLDDPRFSAPTPSDLSSMPSDSLLNGEHEDFMSGNGKRREKMDERAYTYSDDSTSSSDPDDHDESDIIPGEDESITVSGGGDPNNRLTGGLAGRVIQGATEKVNRERREKRHQSPWRKRGADPSPQVPLGGIASLSSAVSSTYPNAQSLPTTSATSSNQTNLHPNNHNIHHNSANPAAAAAGASGQNYISLDAVEDVIRRLILPELAELKNNQRVQANRGLFEQKIAQSTRLSGVSESVKEEALRKLLAKHRSAPDVILSTKLPPERQREVSGGSTVKAGQHNNTGPAATAGKPAGTNDDDDGQPSSKTGMGLDGSVQVPRIVVPQSESPTPYDDEDEQLGQQSRRWRRRKNDHRSHSAVGQGSDGEENQRKKENDADPEKKKTKGREEIRPVSRVKSRFSVRSESSFDSMISGKSEVSNVSRRKSKSLREAENKGLVSSVVKNFNRGGPAGETIDEGDSKHLAPDGTRTELVFRRAGVPDMPFKSAIGSDITRSSIRSHDSEDENEDEDEEDSYDDDEEEDDDDEDLERRREEARQGKRPAFQFQHHPPSPSSPTSRPRSQSPIKRKPLPSAELATTTPRNISDQSNSTLAPGLSSHLDSSRLTTAFTDASTSHLPSATTSEFPSTLAPASSRNIDSILGLGTATGSGSQDVHPPTIFTGLTSDESNLSSHRPSFRSIDDEIHDATGRHVEHTNAKKSAAVVHPPIIGVESAVASLVSSGNAHQATTAGSALSGITQPPTTTGPSSQPSSSLLVSKRSEFKPIGLGSPLKEEMQASSPSRGGSRGGDRAQEEGNAKGGEKSRPSTSSSSSTSDNGDKEETGIATELDIGDFGAELQREAELDQGRSRSRNPSAGSHSSSERSYEDDEAPVDDSDMLGLRETNSSPYPFTRPPKQFESPTQSVSSLRDITPSHPLNHGKGSPMPDLNSRHNQATVEDADEVETNPSIIHGPTSNLAASPGQFETPREALLPEPLVPGGGSGSLRYNPEYMHSQEDYGHVLREETMPSPRDTSERAVNRPGAATNSGVSAALATAALVAGLDPDKMGHGGIGFERSLIGSQGTDGSFPDGYNDQSQNYSSTSESTNPMYESAGRTFETIENKDIMALMQHLTVRDAQRNARDTEILFTLVRSAADMRNSFEEMKRYIAQQDEMIMENNDRQHQITQRAITGPRPLPAGFTKKTTATLIAEEEENRSKKRNVFKRAMKGLSGKNSNELTKIEDMLYHLLIEVEQLRQAQQAGGQVQQQPVVPSGALADTTHMPPAQVDMPPRMSLEDSRHTRHPSDTTTDGEMVPIRLVRSHDYSYFQPQDQRSRPFPQQPYIPADPGLIIDRGLESHQPHRVSPIVEADERSCKTTDRGDTPLTPEEERYIDKTRIVDENSLLNKNRAPTGLIPSPRMSYSDMNDPSNGNNQASHKSTAEDAKDDEQPEKKRIGFFKKFKKGFARKDRNQPEPSSASSEESEPQGTDGDRMEPRGFLDPQETHKQGQDRPPSPLIPSEISGLSAVSEAPRYRVHRDDADLLHPKPRPYATEHHKNQLESEAQHFIVQSPRLDDWASISTATGMSHRKDSGASQFNYHRRNLSDPMSPASDVNSVVSRSQSQSRRAQRVRERDDGPLVPERTNGGYSSYGSTARSNAYQSPSSLSAGRLSPNPGPSGQRKLTGPRPLTSTSAKSSNYQPNRRWSRSPVSAAEEY